MGPKFCLQRTKYSSKDLHFCQHVTEYFIESSNWMNMANGLTELKVLRNALRGTRENHEKSS
jgi:hypothetical protein